MDKTDKMDKSEKLTRLGNIEILTIFKESMITFLDLLMEIFPDESEIIVSKIVIESHIPIELAITKFAEAALPCKQEIQERKDKFFLDDPDLFATADQSRVSIWKSLWKSNRLDADDRDKMWKWLDLFVGLAEMYVENTKNIEEEKSN
jgi:hypothetical protein